MDEEDSLKWDSQRYSSWKQASGALRASVALCFGPSKWSRYAKEVEEFIDRVESKELFLYEDR